ncbi:MAG: DedA family protein [Ktedonobacterales bacterium]
MLHVIRDLALSLLALFHTYEVPTLFVATLIEESGVPIPIPADTLLILAGSQYSGNVGHAMLVIGVSSLAVFLGSSLLFYIMHKGGRPLLVRYGHVLHLQESHLQSMEGWFVRYGRWTIIVARLIPGLRIVATVIAGISGMSFADYVPAAIIAAVVWSTVYFCLGALLGHELPLIRVFFIALLAIGPHWVVYLTAALLLVVIVAGATSLFRKWKRTRPTRGTTASA